VISKFSEIKGRKSVINEKLILTFDLGGEPPDSLNAAPCRFMLFWYLEPAYLVP
jgi:hypothetical protein